MVLISVPDFFSTQKFLGHYGFVLLVTRAPKLPADQFI
jgi:hypothetical protein